MVAECPVIEALGSPLHIEGIAELATPRLEELTTPLPTPPRRVTHDHPALHPELDLVDGRCSDQDRSSEVPGVTGRAAYPRRGCRQASHPVGSFNILRHVISSCPR